MNTSEYVYLDYAATTPMDPRVIKVINEHFKETYGNPSSLHSIGQKAAKILYKSRDPIASLLNGNRRDIIFTSSGTEADNIAIQGVAMKNRDKGNHLITSSIEHHAVENPCKCLENQGFQVTYLSVDENGLIDLEDLKESITPETILISIMFANNEIGTIEPISEIGEVAKDNNIIFHTDAVQAFGKIPIDVKEMNIDLLSASAHKIYGPKGVGMLYMRNQGFYENGERYIQPIMHGGGHEKNMRPSTENVPGIAGFAKAVELCAEEMPEEIKRQEMLRDKIIKETQDKIEDCFLNGHPTMRLPNNVNLTLRFVEGESILLDLDSENIGASTGSACSSTSSAPSHVLRAIGLSNQDAYGSLRVSIGRFTSEQEVDYFLEKLPPIITRLRKISPFKK